jgi:putative peptidoglycan lipid II flippase
MTQGRPEHDPNADAGDRNREWDAPDDKYGRPGFDDAGWQLDLSDVDWGQNPGPRASTQRFGAEDYAAQAYQDGNALGQPPVSYREPAEDPDDWDRRSAKRPGRHSRPHPESPSSQPGPAQPGQAQPGQAQPGRMPLGPMQPGPMPPGPPTAANGMPPAGGTQRRGTGRARGAGGRSSGYQQPPDAQPYPERSARGEPYQQQPPRRQRHQPRAERRGNYPPPVYEEQADSFPARQADPRGFRPDPDPHDDGYRGPAYRDAGGAGPRDPGYRDAGPGDPWYSDSGPRNPGYRDAGPSDPWYPDSGPRDSAPRDSRPRDSGPQRQNRQPDARASQLDGYQSAPAYDEPGPPSPGRSSAPPDPARQDHQRNHYDEPPYDRSGGRPRGQDGYRPPVYEEPGEPGPTRAYIPERYRQPGGEPGPDSDDGQYTGDTQHVRARQPQDYQQRPDERAPGYQPDGHRDWSPAEPDYDYPDEYETGQYDLSAYQPEPFATDYQTDVFELTGYGQAVPGLPPPGLPPPPRTARLAGPPPAALRRPRSGVQEQAPSAAESVSVVRSSGVMAAGTLGSRGTGFLRTLVQNAAIGVVGIGQAYNLSNTLPNVVYNLALGGILTSVVVPLIVAAAKRDSDRGRGYDQRMFTLGTFALLGITLVATALAVPIVHLYSGSKVTGHVQELAIIFAFFFIPQIFFYGLSSLIGAILNARGSFAAPMWTPIVNNVVVLAVFGLYIAIAGVHQKAATISGSEVALLGLGTTLGIVAQTIALVPAMRRVGFRWQPRLDFRRSEVSEIGRMGGWMFCYIAATQVAYLITTKVAGDTGSGISDYSYAWLLFQLPYAVVGISVITALLPRMSAHAHDRRLGLVRADFSTGVRLAATIVVPCSLVLAVLGPSLGQVFFAHGETTPPEARYIGVVFAVFCLGLLPYMIFQLQLRVFYSMHDSRTPAMIGLVTMTVNIVANLLALKLMSKGDLVAGLGVGFGVANLVGMMLAWRILRVRLRGLDGYRIGRSLVRMHAATLPAALLALFIAVVSGNAYLVVIIGGGLGIGVYLLFGRALRIEELAGLTRSLRARLGR